MTPVHELCINLLASLLLIFSTWNDSLLQTTEIKLYVPLQTRWPDNLMRSSQAQETQMTPMTLYLTEIKDQKPYLRYIKVQQAAAQIGSVIKCSKHSKMW